MNSKILYMWLITLLIISQTATIYSQDNNSEGWTQFRGPNRNGISTENLSPYEWSEQKPELIWKKEIGSLGNECTGFERHL